jgi:hypothetical protein
MLSTTRPLFDVETRRVRIYTYGGGLASRTREASGPRKMTVGWVILSVPRRKSVSHAVADEIARARIEIVVATGSAMINGPV